MTAPVVIVGAGDNGLVAACYLARAGKRVVVLEAADKPGGGSRTDETISGHCFDTHAAAHNIIDMTRIPAELDLASAGLHDVPMDPFATGLFRDGRIVRFFRSIDDTVDSIAEHSPADADAYRAFMRRVVPLVRTAVTGLDTGAGVGGLARAMSTKLWPLLQGLRRAGGPVALAQRPAHTVRGAPAHRAALRAHPRPRRVVRQPLLGRTARTRRLVLRVLASRLPPVRAMAPPRRIAALTTALRSPCTHVQDGLRPVTCRP